MKPEAIDQVLRIRQLRLSKAEEALNKARADEVAAQTALEGTKYALDEFDKYREEQFAGFLDRAGQGVFPAQIESMQGFHSDQLAKRDAYLAEIQSAEQNLRQALKQLEQARKIWLLAFQAADNFEKISSQTQLKINRQITLYEEKETEELFGSRTNGSHFTSSTGYPE